jgi:hypothetical protein
LREDENGNKRQQHGFIIFYYLRPTRGGTWIGTPLTRIDPAVALVVE